MRYLTKILVLTACLIAMSGVAAACYNDPLTQGYWKNHPEAWLNEHCVLGADTYNDRLFIGGEECSSMEILNQPVDGDARIILAQQLIAARLNVANNAWYDCDILDIIFEAEDWLEGQESEVSPSDCPEAIAWAEILDQFNNGEWYNQES